MHGASEGGGDPGSLHSGAEILPAKIQAGFQPLSERDTHVHPPISPQGTLCSFPDCAFSLLRS